MSRLTEAIAWTGTDATMILFVVSRPEALREITPREGLPSPVEIRTYHLHDSQGLLAGRVCHEYDLIFQRPPRDIDEVAAAWLEAAITAGAEIAWFAFEGSFHFDHLLTADVADQIFAVGTRIGVDLATEDDYREGPDWATRLRVVRSLLDS